MTLIITLLILGAILLFLETLLPGMIAGIIGFLCLMAAVILGYRDFGYQTGSLILAGVLVGLRSAPGAGSNFSPTVALPKSSSPRVPLENWAWKNRNS